MATNVNELIFIKRVKKSPMSTPMAAPGKLPTPISRPR